MKDFRNIIYLIYLNIFFTKSYDMVIMLSVKIKIIVEDIHSKKKYSTQPKKRSHVKEKSESEQKT